MNTYGKHKSNSKTHNSKTQTYLKSSENIRRNTKSTVKRQTQTEKHACNLVKTFWKTQNYQQQTQNQLTIMFGIK